MRLSRLLASLFFCAGGMLLVSCNTNYDSNIAMSEMLESIRQKNDVYTNGFAPEARIHYYDSLLAIEYSASSIVNLKYNKSKALIEAGREEEAVTLLEEVLQGNLFPDMVITVKKKLALAYLRLGERNNCVYNHSAAACILPISGNGIHKDQLGSSKAIEVYTELLEYDPSDLESKWLLNIAYMTLGKYPDAVPEKFLLKGLGVDEVTGIKPFAEVASNIGIAPKSMAGGAIMEDFDNDGDLDVIVSSWGLEEEGMHYFRNNGDGSFSDLSKSSKLNIIRGGLYIVQTDYNNDGYKDVYVARGAWKGVFGQEPSSLLRNNGDGTFTDVTVESGLNVIGPGQAAVWADFNNDGWLDLYVGKESVDPFDGRFAQLYINNKKGGFDDKSVEANCKIIGFIKGVTAGDYNNDGWMDIFVCGMDGSKRLLRNDGIKNSTIHFTDVSDAAGFTADNSKTFSTWFWDFDNDGWEDILMAGYGINDLSIAVAAASEAAKVPFNNVGGAILYRNNHNGTFTNVSDAMGLNKVIFAMGANFGDIDNDGYLDMYFGTGNPLFESISPNKMFRNVEGKRFEDITIAARVGNLQKGHGVAFGDIDNDGDQDIYIQMGGAIIGDAYQNALYINPGQNNNRWISIACEGTRANKAAIGARIKLTVDENGKKRTIYKRVNSGGSFGANPLRQHIGIGQSAKIETLEISWPGGKTQLFKDVEANQYIHIKEEDSKIKVINSKPFYFNTEGITVCAPA